MKNDQVNHPNHYCGKPHGIECIEITEQMDFLLGNAFKYVWRHKDKGNPLQDLHKAIWYLERARSKGFLIKNSPELNEKLERIGREDHQCGWILWEIATGELLEAIEDIEDKIEFYS